VYVGFVNQVQLMDLKVLTHSDCLMPVFGKNSYWANKNELQIHFTQFYPLSLYPVSGNTDMSQGVLQQRAD
jgi:hypothetical protein